MLSGWGAAIGASALVAWRLSGSLLAAALAVLVGFQFLLLFTNEPLHATSLLLILLALLLCLRFGPGSERAPGTRTMAACGALCAAIALVKLNVGLFVVCAFLGAHPPEGSGRGASIARWALALGLVLLPFALMRALLDEGDVRDFALLVATALIPFAGLSARTLEWRVERKALVAFAAGAAVLSLVCIGACLASGTTIAGLWRSLVLDALAFPTRIHHSPELPGLARILLGLLALPLGWAVRRRPLARALLQLATSLWILYDSLRLQVPLPWLQFLWVPALGGERSTRRAFLGLLAVLLALQAYPVAGSQLGISYFLVPLVAVTGVWEACHALALPGSLARVARVVVPLLAGSAAYVLLAFRAPLWKSWSAWENQWRVMPALDLPGCGALHIPELDVARQSWLAANLKQNADTFVGLAGVPSAHIWSGVPAPVPFYPHHWVLYYDAAQEEELTQALLASPRPCIVRNDYLIDFWTEATSFRDGPFSRALETQFKLAGQVGLYQLWLPRTATPDLVLSVFPAVPDKELLELHGARRAVRLRFPTDADYSIAHIARGGAPHDRADARGRRDPPLPAHTAARSAPRVRGAAALAALRVDRRSQGPVVPCLRPDRTGRGPAPPAARALNDARLLAWAGDAAPRPRVLHRARRSRFRARRAADPRRRVLPLPRPRWRRAQGWLATRPARGPVRVDPRTCGDRARRRACAP